MLLPFVLTAIAIVFAFFVVVKKAASKYFVVDAGFESYNSRHRMSIGDGGGDLACAGCGRSGTKKCSRCKSVRYCSQACQSKHWEEEHKLKCRQVKSSNNLNSDSSGHGEYRRKSPGFGSISLVPARGSCKVLQEPKRILFPYDEFIKLFNWDKPGFPPCGLLNCGNSCFANVVLQCLACTRPLTAYLLERDHYRTCTMKQEDCCFLCELQTHIQRASQSQQPFSPTNILSRIPNIGGNLGYGSQEDAHEFMRFAIDTMQSVCLDEHGGEKALEPSTQETTLIQYIFGGHLQSQVKCTKCNMISNRYENMMDLTVEIHGDAESLEECLDQFTVKEWLDGDNMYKCDGCNGYVKAWKRLTVHQAPNILTITLKRFQSGRFGKLNKRVTFPEELDLSPYMSEGGDGTDLYSLYAVVVHVDMLNASFFGHYICYTKDYYGHWHRFDDCKVTTVDVDEVLSQGAYMLLYSRRTARREPFVTPIEPAKKNPSALNDINLSNVPNGETVSNDLVDLSPNITLESNCNLSSFPSKTGLKSNLSLLRDTGHDRHADVKTDTSKGIEHMESEVNTLLEDLVDVDMKDSELSVLEPEGRKGENLSHRSPIQDDFVAISQDDAVSLLPPTSVEVEDMDYEETSGVASINFPTKDNLSGSAKGDESHFSTKNMISLLSITEPKCSDDSELKPEQIMVEEHYPFGATNGNDKVVNISCKSDGKTENDPIGKSKPLFSRGFLDKSTRDKKSMDHEKRTIKERQKVSTSTIIANGYANGKSELNNKSANATAEMAFINNGFLNAPCRKSASELKASEDNCSISTDALVCDKENGTVFTKSMQYQG